MALTDPLAMKTGMTLANPLKANLNDQLTVGNFDLVEIGELWRGEFVIAQNKLFFIVAPSTATELGQVICHPITNRGISMEQRWSFPAHFMVHSVTLSTSYKENNNE